MASTYIWKPSTVNTWKGGVAFLADQSGSKQSPTVTGANGKTYTGKYVNTNEGRHQWIFDKEVLGAGTLSLNYGGQSGRIDNPLSSYEGSDLGGWQQRAKGSYGDMSQVGGGMFAPGQTGFGFYPAYMGGMFPNPTMSSFNSIKKPKPLKFDPITGKEISTDSVSYDPIQTAPYEKIDVSKFAQDYGNTVRSEMTKNQDWASAEASKVLDDELKNLKNFVPASAALKREQVALDNPFNQSQREAQVNSALPDARENIAGQKDRAKAFAEGRVPDAITDNMLNLETSSAAADAAAGGGFGVRSSSARKAGALMNASQRIALSQYGDQALTAATQNEASLFLAPTEYSNAGDQVQINPSISSAQLQGQLFGQANQGSVLPVSAALSTEVNQNQFSTSLESNNRQFNAQMGVNVGQFNASMSQNTKQFNAQMGYNVDTFNSQMKFNVGQFNTGTTLGVSQFNAQGEFQESQFNANAANSFAMGQFQYNAGYAASVAGAAQTNSNTQLGLQQQAQAQQIYGQQMSATQQAVQAGAVAQGVASIPGIISAGASLVSAFSGGNAGVTGGVTSPNVSMPSGGGISAGGSGSSGGGIEGIQMPDFSANAGSSGSGSGGVSYDPSSGNFNIPDFSADVGGSGGGYTAPQLPEVTSVPSASPAQVSGFASSGGEAGGTFLRSLANDPNQVQTRAIMHSTSQAVMNTAGMYSAPQPGLKLSHMDSSGKPVYVAPEIANTENPRAGEQFVNTIGAILDPTGVFSREDASTLQQVAAASGDVALLTQLDQMHQAGDTKGFSNLLLNRFGQPAVESLFQDPSNKAGVATAFSAYTMMQNWDKMSSAQKSLGLAAIGIKGYKFGSGEDLATKNIINPSAPGEAGLNVGQALNLAAAGVNIYSLTKNWDQLNTLQKVTYGTGTAAQIANTAQQMGMLGSGSTGAVVADVSAEALLNAGWSSAPHYGIGAVEAQAGAQLPSGFQAVATTKDGTQIAIPAANAESASAFTQVGGAASVAAGAYQVYNGWGAGGKKGAVNGLVGGSAMAAGLYTLGVANPYVLGAVVAASVLSNTVETNSNSKDAPNKAMMAGAANPMLALPTLTANMLENGKSKDQMQRDSIRSRLQEVRLADPDFNVSLADGSKFNIGVDGHGQQHEFRRPELVPAGGEVRKLNAWDVDYTNDLDYSASMAATSLARMLSGGKGKAIDHLGGQLTNAAISNIGHGQDFTQGNFSKAMDNMRAMYAQSGIKSKQDAYALANQGFAEGRWNETDLIGMQQAANMVFDNDYNTANRLMQGRWKGINASVTNGKGDAQTTTEGIQSAAGSGDFHFKPGQNIDPGFSIPAGENPFGFHPGESLITPSFTDPTVKGGEFVKLINDVYSKNPVRTPDARIQRPSRMTREEIRAMNEARYQTGVAA